MRGRAGECVGPPGRDATQRAAASLPTPPPHTRIYVYIYVFASRDVLVAVEAELREVKQYVDELTMG